MGVMIDKHNNVVDLQGRLKADRKAILERLFREHAAALRTFLRARLGTTGDHEDILQEVFVRLARMEELPERLQAGRRGNKTFIFTIANHLLVDMGRRKAVRHRYQETESHDAVEMADVDTPEAITENTQNLERLEQAILHLPPLWRKAFVLSPMRMPGRV